METFPSTSTRPSVWTLQSAWESEAVFLGAEPVLQVSRIMLGALQVTTMKLGAF